MKYRPKVNANRIIETSKTFVVIRGAGTLTTTNAVEDGAFNGDFVWNLTGWTLEIPQGLPEVNQDYPECAYGVHRESWRSLMEGPIPIQVVIDIRHIKPYQVQVIEGDWDL
jgi:hypothetical protein